MGKKRKKPQINEKKKDILYGQWGKRGWDELRG